MNQTNRDIGGANNRKGNRFEDAFAVARLLELAPLVFEGKSTVRIKEQAGCPVDDLLICESARRHYYQLKDDQTITWGRENGKLTTLFVTQKAECEARKEEFSLGLVVSEDHRKDSLDANMPASLTGAVTVVHFQRLRRPSELSRRSHLQPALKAITARREPGPSDLEQVATGFYLAWVECELDHQGFANLGDMIAWLHGQPMQVRRPVPTPPHPKWNQFESILSHINGLEWHVDRGYFEWFLRPTDSGLSARCDSPSFRSFVDRVLATPPTTFGEFEGLLP